MKKHLSYFVFIYVLFMSCNSSDKHPDSQSQIRVLPDKIDSTAIEELTSAAHFYERFTIAKNHPSNHEKIDSLNANYDSLQIRFWNVGGLYMNRQLYILKYNLGNWSGYYFQLSPEPKYANGDSSLEYLKGPTPLQVEKYQKVTPKNGWANLIDSLIKLDIFTLPDMSKIPDMKIKWTDAGSTYIEISSDNLFRFYHYSDPHSFVREFQQAAKIMSIESLLYSELVR